MYVIAGASGNTGSVVAEKLLARGRQVRVLGRDAAKLARLTAKGAQAMAVDLADTEGLTRAFEGAQAAFVLIPPSPAAPDVLSVSQRISDAVTAAIRKAGVPKAVALSSVGADKPEKTGPVMGLHNLERQMDEIAALDAVYLRAGYFMENLLPQTDVVRNFGMVAGPLRADLPLPLIATKDIGNAAAEFLLKLDFKGKKAVELLGQRDVSYAEVATIIGKAIGKPELRYQQLPPQQVRPIFVQLGMSANMADLILEMTDALNSTYMRALEPRSQANTTPTSIETFIDEVFVPRYQQKAAGA